MNRTWPRQWAGAWLGLWSLAAQAQAYPGPTQDELRDTFRENVAAALQRSPQLRRQQAEFEAAQSDVDEARGQRWPQIQLGAQSAAQEFGGSSDSDRGDGSGLNLSMTTPVFTWGRIGKTIDSQRYAASAAEAGVAAEREVLAADVIDTLLQLGEQRIVVDVSLAFERRMIELVEMLGGIVKVDAGRASELTQARARLLQARAAREAAQTRVGEAQIQLRKLTGERPLALPRGKSWNLYPAQLDSSLEQVPLHPTLQQTAATAEAAQTRAEAVRASALPRLDWVVSKSSAEDSLGREQPWQTSLAVTWDVFRGGSTQASERAALQRAAASREANDQQQLDLEYQVRTAHHDADMALQRADLYRDLSLESDQVRQAFYQQWYHLGRRTLLDVLIAENDHYQNQVNEVTSRFEGYRSIFREYAAAGTLTRWLGVEPVVQPIN